MLQRAERRKRAEGELGKPQKKMGGGFAAERESKLGVEDEWRGRRF